MVSTGRRHGPDEIYEAMNVFVEHGLRANDSAFTPGRPIWTADNFGALKVRFVDRPDTGSDSFNDKLRRQLGGCTPGQVQLMAELMYVHLLINSITTGPKKRGTIEEILSLIDGVAIPENLAAALDHGALNPGTFFNTRRDLQLSFLVRFGIVWKALPTGAAEQALRDPWRFDEILDSVELESAFTQREALKHLVHPATFEAISSQDHKKRIIGALGDLVAEAQHSDRKIALIRDALTLRLGEDFDFYSEGAAYWRNRGWAWPETVRWARQFLGMPSFLDNEVNWKVDAAERLRGALEAFVADGTTEGLSSRLSKDSLTNGIAASMWVEWAAAHHEEASAAIHAAWSDDGTAGERMDAFLENLSSEKLAGAGSRATVGATVMLAGNPHDFPIFRVRVFEAFAKLVGADRAPKNATSGDLYDWALGLLDGLADHLELRGVERPSRLACQGLVFTLTKWQPGDPQPDSWGDEEVAEFLDWRGRVAPSDDEEVVSPAVADIESPDSVAAAAARPAMTLDQLADDLHLDPAWMRKLVTLLEHRPQLILQGPPGTGKTYVALALAEHLAGGKDGVRLVQFHASYAYEDFVQGWRPEGEGFALMPGPLLRLAERARKDRDRTYVMVIDELNRGDVARVFGELFFLLENRGKTVDLQYGTQPFSLPANLWFIATMNTADRSIAIVDGALRRRFHFVDFTPAKAPVDALLRSWLERNKPSMAWVADVVDQANLMLEEDLAIGPSHFLDDNLDDDLVELVWDHSVLPYVREQLFGRLDDFSEFSLDVLRAKVQAAVNDDADAD
jgi:MoxR-like ATPase